MENTVKRNRLPVNAAEIIGWVSSVIPGFLLLGVIVLAMVVPAVLSFASWNMIQEPEFIGWENYITLFTRDNVFPIALYNSLVDLLVIGVGGFLLCMLIAWLLDSVPKVVRYVVLILLMAPTLCPGMISVIRQMLGSDTYAFVNALLMAKGIIEEPIRFMYAPDYLPHIVRAIQFVRSIGPGVLVISVGLQSVRSAARLEARQRGIANRPGVLWHVVMPRMRMPLMLAAVVMVMGAMGTGDISQQMVAGPSWNFCVHTLWLHVWDCGMYKMGYASSVFCVMLAIEVLVTGVMCLCIWLLTIRPGRRKLACTSAPETLGAELPRRDIWRILGLLFGWITALLLCVLPLLLLFREVNAALMLPNELFTYPPHFMAENPALNNFPDMLGAIDDIGFPVWTNIWRALLFAGLPGVLLAAVAGFAGYGCSRRRSTVMRCILLVLAILYVLAEPVLQFRAGLDSYEDLLAFSEARHWILWAFLTASIALGFSMGEMLRRKRPAGRIVLAAGGYLSLLLLLCWYGSWGSVLPMIADGNVARQGVGSACGVITDLVSLLLSIPFVIGAFQLLLGTPDTRPLYRGGNE